MNGSDISCDEVIERLFDYLHRELDTHTRQEIHRHLERCHDCFSRAEFEQLLREKIANTATQTAPERLRRRVAKLIRN